MPAVQPRPAAVALTVALVAALLAVLVPAAGLGAAGVAVGAVGGAGLALAVSRGLHSMRSPGLGPADLVTLARAALSCGVAALVAEGLSGTRTTEALLVALAASALALDAVDGQVARRTGTASAFGARFDGEADAFLILVLSAQVSRTFGPLVLALGAARYAFWAGGLARPWMRAPLPPRYWRKLAAATVGVSLLVVASGALPQALALAVLATAGALLAESFGRDVLWLWRRRPRPTGTTRHGAVQVSALPGRPVEAARVAGDVPAQARRARARLAGSAPLGTREG